MRASRSSGRSTTQWQPFADQPRSRQRFGVGLGVVSLRRRAPRPQCASAFSAVPTVSGRGRLERELRLVDDRVQVAHRRRRRASAGRDRGRRRRSSTPPRSTSSEPRRAAARSPRTPPCRCRSHCRRRRRRSCRRRPEPRSDAKGLPPTDPRRREHRASEGWRRRSGRSPASAGSSPMPQRTIILRARRARTRRTRRRRASAVRPEARTSEISRLRVEPFDLRRRSACRPRARARPPSAR